MVENLIQKKKGINHAISLFNCGANLIDIGGESTRPGSKVIRENLEWQRIEKILKSLIKRKIPISLDTRKSKIMGKGCLLYTSPSPRDISGSRMPSSA